MREKRVVLRVEVALDGVPGSMDNVGDFVRHIARRIPSYYLRSILMEGQPFVAERMSQDLEEQNYLDVLASAERLEETR